MSKTEGGSVEAELYELRRRLQEAEDTLEVIRAGEVDALVLQGTEGLQVYTLQSADYSYRVVLNTMNEGVVTLTADRSIAYCNQRFSDIVCVPSQSILGRRLADFVVGEPEELIDQLMTAAQQEPQTAEVDLFCGDDKRITPARLSVTAFDVEGLSMFSVLVTDLTEQKRTAEEMAQRNAELESTQLDLVAEQLKLQAVLSTAPIGIVMTDAEGKIIWTNPAADALYARPVPFGQPIDSYATLQLCHPDGTPWESYDLPLAHSALHGETFTDVDMMIKWPDGQNRRLMFSTSPIKDVHGQITGAVGAFYDWTETAQRQQERERERRRWQRLAEVAEVALRETTAEGIMQRLVEAARELTGARYAVAGQGHRAGRFTNQAVARADDAPQCPEGETFTVDRGGVYLALMQQPSIRLTDAELRSHPMWRGLPESHVPLRGLLGASVIDKDGVSTGMLLLSDKQEGDFTVEDEALVNQLAALASLGIRNIAAQESLRALVTELTLTEERERRDIASALHDTAGQSLAFTRIKLSMARAQTDVDIIKRELKEVDELLATAIAETRSLTMDLSPPVLYQSGLTAAIEWLAGDMQARHAYEVTVTKDDQETPLTEEARVMLFKAVRELLINSAKHAQATQVSINVVRRGHAIEIQIADNGKGFDPQAVRQSAESTSFGLFNIKERVTHLGGTFKIDSSPGAGARFTIIAPISFEDSSD
ncbi:MAG: sensor histidine kinase [Armatimonadota bacterium]